MRLKARNLLSEISDSLIRINVWRTYRDRTMATDDDLMKCLDEKIKWGLDMIGKLEPLGKVEGVDKLVRKIQREIKFLKKVHSTGYVKKEHLRSTNLIHLNAIVQRLLVVKSVVNVLKPVKFHDSKLEVDIVCDGGSSWVKVIARNPRALTLISDGSAGYKRNSIFDQAHLYLNCALKNPHMYKNPKIIFHFACGIEKLLALKLIYSFEITVEGEIIDTITHEDVAEKKIEYFESDTESEESVDTSPCTELNLNTNIESKNNSILNLDVSTLLAYISNMTNGYANFAFSTPLLNMQSEWEREHPLKPVLDNLFKNKELVVCQTAYDNFTSIVNLIGGPNEKKRSTELMSRIKVVEDIAKGRMMQLNLGGKIKLRSRLIFASGDEMESVTVSANEGFVRAARMQGIECVVFIHKPRSLSEMKQVNATKIELS